MEWQILLLRSVVLYLTMLSNSTLFCIQKIVVDCQKTHKITRQAV